MMMEETKRLYQRDVKGYTNDFLFENWFTSKISSGAAIDFDADMISMVKTYSKGFYKYTI